MRRLAVALVALVLATPALAAYPNQPIRLIVPIPQTVLAAQVLTVHPKSPARDLAGFIDLAKAKAQQLSVGSAGNGSIGHLTLESFKRQAAITLVHVPYRGGGPAANDLLGGHLDGLVVSLPAVTQHIRAGAMRALAVSTPGRVSAVSDVPSFAEAGLPGFAVISWQGLLAPAHTPPDIIDALHREVARILALPDIAKQLTEQGFEPVGGTPEALGALIRRDVNHWADVIKASGIAIE